MSPDERDRLTKVEQQFADLKEDVSKMDGKIDELLKTAHMGRGAWMFLLRLGAIVVALAAAASWAWDHIVAMPKH